jgi:hypothetical protein
MDAWERACLSHALCGGMEGWHTTRYAQTIGGSRKLLYPANLRASECGTFRQRDQWACVAGGGPAAGAGFK